MATAHYHEEHEELEGTPTAPVDTMINAYPFFTVLAHGIVRVLAHGIARPFMVDSPGWRLAISFIVRSVQSHISVYLQSEVATNSGAG